MRVYCVTAFTHDSSMLVDVLGLVHTGWGAWSRGRVDKHELDERVRGYECVQGVDVGGVCTPPCW